MPLQSPTSDFSPFLLAESLIQMDPENSLPRDLPGRYGRTIRDLERLLIAVEASSVVAGGWAVWRHGYAGRVTEDVDIVIAADKIDNLKQKALVFGFEFYESSTGRWPKLCHIATRIDVDVLPESGIPGTPTRPAPVPIGHPQRYQAVAGTLNYISLHGLIELKLGAGRAKDIADLIELIKCHPTELQPILDHLATLHPNYVTHFQTLIQQAADE